jgi:two-component system cell cycle sensor histidine kinase/response regulator CckA
MDSQVLARVFEPFYSTKPKGRGTGLGLATVYGIVTQAGGYVQIYSEPGFGTSVSVHAATDR